MAVYDNLIAAVRSPDVGSLALALVALLLLLAGVWLLRRVLRASGG